MAEIDVNKHGRKSPEITTPSSQQKSAIVENTVIGMEDDFNTIHDRVTDQAKELTVIPIFGMDGIGKTTLKFTTKVYNDSYIGYRFDKDAWVTISEEYNERQMLLEVVSSITGSHQEKRNDELMEIVYRGLKGRRFLIVIDDIWSTEAWDQMRRIFPNDGNKSRILLTTQLKHVVDYVSCPGFSPHRKSFLQDLIDRSLILAGEQRANGRIRTCRMHDLLRQLCQREAHAETFVHMMNRNVMVSSEAIVDQRRVIVPSKLQVAHTLSSSFSLCPKNQKNSESKKAKDRPNWPSMLRPVNLVKELETLYIEAEQTIDQLIFYSGDIFPCNLKQLKLSYTCIPWDVLNLLADLPNLELLKGTYAFAGTEWKLKEDAVFQKLKYLQIANGDLQRWEAAGGDNFPMLEQLILYGLTDLEEIPDYIGEIMTLKLIMLDLCLESIS